MGKTFKKNKNLIRDAMTRKIVRPNQEVILVKNLVPYARKLGYIISNRGFKE